MISFREFFRAICRWRPGWLRGLFHCFLFFSILLFACASAGVEPLFRLSALFIYFISIRFLYFDIVRHGVVTQTSRPIGEEERGNERKKNSKKNEELVFFCSIRGGGVGGSYE